MHFARRQTSDGDEDYHLNRPNQSASPGIRPLQKRYPHVSAPPRDIFVKIFRLFKVAPRKNCVQQRHQGATVRSPILDSKSFIAALMSRGNEMFQATDDLYARSAEPIVSRHASSKGLGV